MCVKQVVITRAETLHIHEVRNTTNQRKSHPQVYDNLFITRAPHLALVPGLPSTCRKNAGKALAQVPVVPTSMHFIICLCSTFSNFSCIFLHVREGLELRLHFTLRRHLATCPYFTTQNVSYGAHVSIHVYTSWYTYI